MKRKRRKSLIFGIVFIISLITFFNLIIIRTKQNLNVINEHFVLLSFILLITCVLIMFWEDIVIRNSKIKQ